MDGKMHPLTRKRPVIGHDSAGGTRVSQIHFQLSPGYPGYQWYHCHYTACCDQYYHCISVTTGRSSSRSTTQRGLPPSQTSKAVPKI
eukprot:3940332-Rhodomonas_salina.2